MDAEAILYAVAAIANWRAVVALVAFAFTAWLLVFALPLMSGVQGIVFALTGLGIGFIWQEHRSLDASTNQPDLQTRPSVAAACAAFLSLCWGLASADSLLTATTGAAILCLALVAHTSYYRRMNLISHSRARLCIYFASLGYVAGIIARNFTA